MDTFPVFIGPVCMSLLAKAASLALYEGTLTARNSPAIPSHNKPLSLAPSLNRTEAAKEPLPSNHIYRVPQVLTPNGSELLLIAVA